MWRRARRYAGLIWAIPFVRLIAVTGALAVDNVEPGDDIDFLIVTEPGRLWLTRGLTILLCKIARRRGQRLCPNYLLSTRALHLEQHDLYTAHELVQMAPLHGTPVTLRLWSENRWFQDFLPNAVTTPPTDRDRLPIALAAFKLLGERILRLPAFDAVERWERERKITRLGRVATQGRALQAAGGEAVFNEDVCKGHCHGHGRRVLRLYAERLEGAGTD
jgi:hypothetical protein